MIKDIRYSIRGLLRRPAFTARQRTNEIGIRIALGVQSWNVLRLIVGQGSGLAAIGIAKVDPLVALRNG